MSRLQWLLPLVFFVISTPISPAAMAESDSQPPLHAQIDAVLARTNVHAAGPIADDATFLRRVYLDLTGTIPTLDAALSFLADENVDKRQALVDHLLHTAAYARHMASTFDVILMERRAEKHVTQADWSNYLFQYFDENKPLDQLFAELLRADATQEPAARPAMRFFSDRNCDPNLLTRDIGRIVFGMDYQCAQCHDHPLISDYLQADYHGMLAFVQRSYVFTSADQKTIAVAEKGDGDSSFKSVFKPDEPVRTAVPHTPGGVRIVVPVPLPHETYKVVGTDAVMAVPEIGLRVQLAEQATHDNPAFARNLANRLWGHMMARPIVDPPDLHHSSNPASNPLLLDLLASALQEMHFDARQFLREIALSSAYQRSAWIAPDDVVADIETIASELERDRQELEQVAAELETRTPAVEASRQARADAQLAFDNAYAQYLAAAKQRNELIRQRATLDAELTATQQQRDVKAGLQQTLAAALEASQKASAVFQEDQQLGQALQLLQQRSTAIANEHAELEKKLNEQRAAISGIAEQLQAAERNSETTYASLLNQQETLGQARDAHRQAARPWQLLQHRRQVLFGRIADAERVMALSETWQAVQSAGGISSSSADAAQQLTQQHQELLQQWDRRHLISGLKPLTPEQLASSILVATGEWELMARAARDEWAQAQAKKQEAGAASAAGQADAGQADAAAAKDAGQSENKQESGEESSAKHAEAEREVERILHQKVYAQQRPFVQLFGAAAGQPQGDFFASVDQALFLANGSPLQGWTAPGEKRLTTFLANASNDEQLAHVLYMSVLTRSPSREELSEVKAYLAENVDRRERAIQDLVWSLLVSPEFRFRP